ncbi:MAG: ATP-binding cassette domain-containing protein [Treponema sp.]|nr:ATP-binding cassette domain-containing protein [Treponema sp.]
MPLRAEGISKEYYRPTETASHFAAVKKTDIVLTEKSLTVLTGRSGSGKSTVLYMLAGLLRPTTGTVFLDDSDLYTLNDSDASRLRNRTIGIIPQGQTGIYALSVLENVLLPALLFGRTETVERHARELLERVGIASLADARLQELSGGELRRMAIARALVMQPRIVLADEPTDDLDDENTKLVLELLRRTADAGAVVLLVTHEASARLYADSIYRMDGGVLTPQG